MAEANARNITIYKRVGESNPSLARELIIHACIAVASGHAATPMGLRSYQIRVCPRDLCMASA
jgi:hypothetical protein